MSAILLMLPRTETKQKIADRIDLGQQLINEPIQSRADIDRIKNERRVWRSYNKEMLRTLFSSDEPAEEYGVVGMGVGGGALSPEREIFLLHREIERDLVGLRAILEKTELWQETAVAEAPAGSVVAGADHGDAVFIVHGRSGREYEVARAVEKLGVEAVILQERLHRGSTLIEKLVREARSCGFAIVLYTADDEGRIVGSTDELAMRARENVVLELGYFVGLLGRERVTILRDSEVTVPSDFEGVGYYTIDDAGAWKESVKGELQSVGLID